MSDVKSALQRIEEYARAHDMKAAQIEESFLGGWFAAKALRKDWLPTSDDVGFPGTDAPKGGHTSWCAEDIVAVEIILSEIERSGVECDPDELAKKASAIAKAYARARVGV